MKKNVALYTCLPDCNSQSFWLFGFYNEHIFFDAFRQRFRKLNSSLYVEKYIENYKIKLEHLEDYSAINNNFSYSYNPIIKAYSIWDNSVEIFETVTAPAVNYDKAVNSQYKHFTYFYTGEIPSDEMVDASIAMAFKFTLFVMKKLQN